MRSKQIVAAIFALIFFSSCSIDNLEPNHKVVGSSDIITVLGRVSNFTEQDVVTRSPKDSEERKVTSIAMAIFPVKNDGTGVNGDCVYYEYFPNSNEVMFAINRGDNTFNNGRYVIYAFANMPGMNVEGFGKGTSLEAMLSKAYNLSETTVDIPTDGFPMVGSLGDTFSANTERDNKILYIKPDGDSDPNITPKPGDNSDPIIREPIKNEAGNITWDGGRTENTLTIPMKAMYAKINFSIKIDPIEKDETGINFPPQFTFEGYTIKNIPTSVDFDMATNSDTEVIDSIAGTGVEGKSILVDKDDELTFSFYLPERLLNPVTDPNFSYPFTPGNYDEIVDKDQNGYRDEDEITRQRYKGLLLGSGQKATNVVISGKYRDHQNLSYDVDYTIHLGEDNYADFNILRNKEYNNYVTIRGIENSNDNKDNYISFDHRVNITRSQPAIISLRREMLLDSHFEIRPLRIRKSDVGNVGNINAVKVEVVNPTTTDWMRIERSFGDGSKDSQTPDIYINEGVSAGKRKYFTYGLVSGEQYDKLSEPNNISNGTSVIVPITDAGECVWIYVDECTETGDGVRSGVIQVTYGNLTGNSFTETTNTEAFPVVKYSINQRKLFEVTDPTGEYNYYIEYEEEYLYNFDSEDNYGGTAYEGIEWGLDKATLSFDNPAVVFNTGDGWFSNIIDYFVNQNVSSVSPFYDFYIDKYDTSIMPTSRYRSNRHGYYFCRDIIKDINTKDNPKRVTNYAGEIDVLNLSQKPQSAIEYCYNKNKRNSGGKVVMGDDEGWYLPAIDEIEDIVMGDYIDANNTPKKSYARFLDFQDKYYWSCQPAYVSNNAHYANIANEYGSLYWDHILNARATKVSYYNNNYHLVTSGTTGYENVVFFRSTDEPVVYNLITNLGDNESFTYTYWYIYRNITRTISKSNLMQLDEGHHPRTRLNRVRCVRKMPEN